MQRIKYYFEKYKIILLVIPIFIIILRLIIINSKNEDEIEEEQITYDISETLTNLIKVEIKGLVKNPGVYEMDQNSRVIDLINKAGGLIENASTKNLNLSKKIADEDVIFINSIEEENNYALDNFNTNMDNKNSNDGLISINTSSIDELSLLPQIGLKKAQAIIDYRTQNGPFKSLDEIMNVSGIGDKIYSKIKDYIKL